MLVITYRKVLNFGETSMRQSEAKPGNGKVKRLKRTHLGNKMLIQSEPHGDMRSGIEKSNCPASIRDG